MKELTLRNSPKVALVDDDVWERLQGYNWRLDGNGYPCNATSISNITKILPLANVVMCDRFSMYDHVDRNPLNCQKSNLRKASVSLNLANRPKRVGCSSQYKGVSWVKARNKWKARAKLNGNEHALGYFINEIDAAKAYNIKAKELFGEFAVLNDV